MPAESALLVRTVASWVQRGLRLCVTGLVLALAACRGGDSPPAAAAATALLSGDDASLASSALVTTRDAPAAAGDISHGFLLTRMLVLLQPTATIGQVNAAARAVGALAITSADPASLLVLIKIPKVANVAAAQALAATLRAQPGIAFAWPGQTAKVAVLPENAPGSPVPTFDLPHLLANRFPQGWNARNGAPADCLPRAVGVYVWDEFGDPAVRPDFFQQIDANSFVSDPGGPGPGLVGHGYDVALTLAGKFDAGIPTGTNGFADCVEIHQVEADGYDYAEAIRRVVIAIAPDPDPRVLLTVSFVFTYDDFCGADSAQHCDAGTLVDTPLDTLRNVLESRAILAGEWARLFTAAHLDQKVLITQAAGNVDPAPDGFLPANYLGFGSVPFSSPTALATHLANLTALLTDATLWRSADPGLPDFTFDALFAQGLVQGTPLLDPANAITADNLLVVDSGTAGEVPADIHPSSFNFTGADVRAVGEGVVLPTGNVDGTSFSTPEVAGLAAFLWNLSPALQALPPAATAGHLRTSARLTANSPDVPVVDAYAAVLRLDDVPGCCGGQQFAPIRLGLMDVDGDGRFTGADLQKFSDAYGLANPSTPTIPAARDYSRFDLNGDGFTGGILNTAFDVDVNGLDANGQPKINTAHFTVEGFDVDMNEAALSDLQILCFYTYSLLYDGSGQNAQLRDNLLGAERCAGVTMNLALTSVIPLGSSGSLSMALQQDTGAAQPAPAGNVPYELQSTGGTVSPASGTTDANGHAAATVTPDPGSTSVTVTAVAKVCPGCAVLARGSASAQVTTSPSAGGHYAGNFSQSCSLFGNPPTVTGGAATLDLGVSQGNATNAVVIAPSNVFFKNGDIFTLFGPVNSFEGFHDSGSFTWTATGSANGASAHMDVDMVGLGCTFTFDGALVPP